LKEKIGTRTLASAEIDFHDAIAYPIGLEEVICFIWFVLIDL
jgi:hypothetical protein